VGLGAKAAYVWKQEQAACTDLNRLQRIAHSPVKAPRILHLKSRSKGGPKRYVLEAVSRRAVGKGQHTLWEGA